jgi:hypothetical protein
VPTLNVWVNQGEPENSFWANLPTRGLDETGSKDTVMFWREIGIDDADGFRF